MDFLTFFGLKEDPFKLTPDPSYFYPSSSHNEGLLLMDYSIDQKEGFLLIIGDPGTGKTTLLKVFIEKWKESAEIAIVLTPRLSPEDFLASVAEDLNISSSNKNKNELIKSLRDFMLRQSANERRVIIIVDEAQNLPDETLEELRLLSNLETDKDKLIQIILLGQPELESKLMSDSLRQLNQRIVTRVHLQHFNHEETRDYINFRLIKAGKENLKVHSKAVKSVYRYTNGVPRLINMLISRSLMAAYLEESNTILNKHIQHAIKSLNHSDMELRESNIAVPLISGAAALLAISIAAFLYISSAGKIDETSAVSISKPSAEEIVPIGSSPEQAETHIVSAKIQKPIQERIAVVKDKQTHQDHDSSSEGNTPLLASSSSIDNIQSAQDNELYTYTDPDPLKLITVNVDVAIIRTNPSLNANRVGSSEKGSQLEVFAEVTDTYNTKWYLVPYNNQKHWISSEVVDEIQFKE